MSEVSGGAPGAAPSTTAAVPATNTAPVTASSEQVLDKLDPTIQDTKAPTAQEVKEYKKKIKAKANGRDIEYDIDFNDDKKLQELVSKAMGADEKFQKAATIEKQMQQLIEVLQGEDGIWEVARQMGKNPDEIVQKYVDKFLQDQEKSPEQKEMERIKQELETERNKAKKLENEKLSVEKQRVQDEFARNLEQEIDAAFKDSHDIPKSPYTVSRMAQTMIAFMDKGYQITAQQAAQIVRADTSRELQEMFNQMPEEAIEKLLGDNNNKRLREKRRAKAKQMQTAAQVKPTGNSEIERHLNTQTGPKGSAKDFFKKLS